MYLHPAPLDRSYSLREFDILNGILPIFSNPHINSMTYETLNQAYGFPLRWYFLVQVTSIMGKHLWFLNPHQWHFEGIPNNYYQTKPPFRVTAAEVANRINGIKNPMISSTPWGCTSMRRQEFVDLSVASHTLHWRNIADLDITLKSMGQNIFMFHCYGRSPKVFSFDCADISMVLASK